MTWERLIPHSHRKKRLKTGSLDDMFLIVKLIEGQDSGRKKIWKVLLHPQRVWSSNLGLNGVCWPVLIAKNWFFQIFPVPRGSVNITICQAGSTSSWEIDGEIIWWTTPVRNTVIIWPDLPHLHVILLSFGEIPPYPLLRSLNPEKKCPWDALIHIYSESSFRQSA